MNQVVVKQEKSGYQIVEAYKSLRTNLQFCGEDKKVIAVTSCTPNEGKSSVSMQLGISLAESGKRVILIDADLRKSVLLGRTKTQKSVRGLAHFLEHMAFNGSKNFPDKGMDEFTQSIGMRMGENFNAYTSFDETI